MIEKAAGGVYFGKPNGESILGKRFTTLLLVAEMQAEMRQTCPRIGHVYQKYLRMECRHTRCHQKAVVTPLDHSTKMKTKMIDHTKKKMIDRTKQQAIDRTQMSHATPAG